MAKWFMAHKEISLAIKQLESIQHQPFEHTDRALYDLSMLYKKQDRLQEAASLWERLMRSDVQKCRYDASIELAKYLEHKKKSTDAHYM